MFSSEKEEKSYEDLLLDINAVSELELPNVVKISTKDEIQKSKEKEWKANEKLIAISLHELLKKDIPAREFLLAPWLPKQGL